jgi:hypothetical protein
MRFNLMYSLPATALIFVVAASHAQKSAKIDSVRERLVGAWHLVSMEEPGPDG